MADPDTNRPQSRAELREQRRANRHERRDMVRSLFGGLPLGGLILLVIGGVLLARNLGMQLPENWWAAFLLIPAGGALVAAIRAYRVDERFSNRVVGSLAGGLIFLVLACSLYFGVAWGIFWPLILMLIGAGLMARGYFSR